MPATSTVAPFVDVHRNHGGVHGIDAPLTTVSARGNHHGLTVPEGHLVVHDVLSRHRHQRAGLPRL